MTITVITVEQNVIGDGVPVTAVVKMSNQLWSKYYIIKTKQNQPKPGTKMHRGALATANHARRVSGGDKLNWWVSWTRKVKAELGQALPRRQWR